METIIHNQTKERYRDIERSAEYYLSNQLEKYPTTSKWESELWVKEKTSNDSHNEFECGIRVFRPDGADLYVTKSAETFNKAIKDAVSTLKYEARS